MISRRIRRMWSAVCRYQRIALGGAARWHFVVLAAARCRPFSDTSRLGKVGKRLFPIICVRPKALRGRCVTLDPSDPSHLDIFDEVYVSGNYDLDRVPFKPDFIIDCGGHVGFFTSLAAARYPSTPICVFEPMAENRVWLDRMLQRSPANVEVRQEAVSVRDGRIEFNIRNSCGGSIGGDTSAVVTSRIVPTIDLRRLLKAKEVGRLLLKMDVEGEEETLLPAVASLLPRECAIFFETHTGDVGWKAVVKALTQVGFQVSLDRDRGAYRDGMAVRSIAMAG